jgi:hypothetical protein
MVLVVQAGRALGLVLQGGPETSGAMTPEHEAVCRDVNADPAHARLYLLELGAELDRVRAERSQMAIDCIRIAAEKRLCEAELTRVTGLLEEQRAEVDALRAELAQAEVLAEMGTACIDWASDTDDCHLCQRSGDGAHHPECPVGKFLAALIERATSGSTVGAATKKPGAASPGLHLRRGG